MYGERSFWGKRFVRCPEVRGCPYLGGFKYTTHMEIAVGATACVRCTEVVRISECPLIEVLLYMYYACTAELLIRRHNPKYSGREEVKFEDIPFVKEEWAKKLVYTNHIDNPSHMCIISFLCLLETPPQSTPTPSSLCHSHGRRSCQNHPSILQRSHD